MPFEDGLQASLAQKYKDTRSSTLSEIPKKPAAKVICIDFHANPIARYPYETDPRKHFSSLTKTDFKGYSLALERKLNQRRNTSPLKQRILCDQLSRTKLPEPTHSSSSLTARNFSAEDRGKLEQYRSEKKRAATAPRAWHP